MTHFPRTLIVPAVILLAGAASSRSQAPQSALRPCTMGRTSSECGSITVFEDRAAGKGRTIEIHFAVARASSPGAREAVFAFAGGPGEGSTSMAGAADGWLRPLRATMDIVFVDQRGTGQSHPLPCVSDAATRPAEAFGHVFNPSVVARCRAALSRDADLTKYTTDDAVADVDQVRAFLGYERVSLYGGSYGTRMAQAYMRRFPARVRSAVIDGVVPFDNAIPLTYAASAQRSVGRVWMACAANPECKAAHRDPAADFDRLLHRFDRGPIDTMVSVNGVATPVRMSRGDFGYAVRGMLYSADMVSRLPDLVAKAADTGDVSEFARAYWSREVSMENRLAFGLHLSVLCAEDVPFPSEADIASATAGTFLGRYLFDDYRAACGLWPRGRVAADARTPVTVKVPTLLVSGAFDPVTPPAFAERVAKGLPLSLAVTAPTGSHGSATGCPRAAALYVLEKATFEGVPTVCR
jgi:pimeloyl-ACP methyl ester carboxylesterase